MRTKTGKLIALYLICLIFFALFTCNATMRIDDQINGVEIVKHG
jgi:hypothetical protein